MGLFGKNDKKKGTSEETTLLLSSGVTSATYFSAASTSALSTALHVNRPVPALKTRERILEDQRIYGRFAQDPVGAVSDILIAIYILPKTLEEYEEFLREGAQRKAALYDSYRAHSCSMFCSLDESVQLETSRVFELFHRQIETQLDGYQNLAKDDLFPVPLLLCQIVFEKIINRADQSNTIELLKKFDELFMVLSTPHAGHLKHFTQKKMEKVADLILQKPSISVEEAVHHLNRVKIPAAASSSVHSFHRVHEMTQEIELLAQMMKL